MGKFLKEWWQVIIFFLTVIFTVYFFYMMNEFDKDKQDYDLKYIKENPEMTVVINTYYDCLNNKVTAIEGCLDYSAKTPETKDKLIKYDALIDKMKKDKLF